MSDQYDEPDYDNDTGVPDVEAAVGALVERANTQDLNALVQAHPDLADEEAAKAFMEQAETMARAAGNPAAANDPGFLRHVADLRSGGPAAHEPQFSDGESIKAMLEAETSRSSVLPF